MIATWRSPNGLVTSKKESSRKSSSNHFFFVSRAPVHFPRMGSYDSRALFLANVTNSVTLSGRSAAAAPWRRRPAWRRRWQLGKSGGGVSSKRGGGSAAASLAAVAAAWRKRDSSAAAALPNALPLPLKSLLVALAWQRIGSGNAATAVQRRRRQQRGNRGGSG